MVTRADVAAGFQELGLSPGGVLLIHSSLSSFGKVEGGAETVIDGIMDVLGPDGALLAPTLTGHEGLSPDNPPHVDLRAEPCWTGRIPETLRQRPDAVRSIHPTHSCAAIGGRAEEVTRGHHLSPTPCGVTSPYFRCAMAGGHIAMIGCTLSTCTTCHTVEELANVGYHLQRKAAFGSCIDRSGHRVDTPCLLHSYEGPPRDFPVMEPILLEKGLMRIGCIGDSTVRLIDSMGLIESALERLRFDPYYLTELRTLDRKP
jgi:aminoglycoside 3-N-acetyltransferase